MLDAILRCISSPCSMIEIFFKVPCIITKLLKHFSNSSRRGEKFKFVFNGNVASINAARLRVTIISLNNCGEYSRSPIWSYHDFFKTQLLLLNIFNSLALLCISCLFCIWRLFTRTGYEKDFAADMAAVHRELAHLSTAFIRASSYFLSWNFLMSL